MGSTTTIRRRSSPFFTKKGMGYRQNPITGVYSCPRQVYEFHGPLQTQYTESEGHRYRDRGYDTGGPFFTKRTRAYVETIGGNVLDVTQSGGDHFHYEGPLMPVNTTTLSYPTSAESSDATLSAYGTTAVARCSPTNPVANLSVFLGETLRDGLPSIPGIRGWEERVQILRAAGNEFLNVVFGWEPLISDIKSTAKAMRHAHTVLKQFERDAGKVVRRSYVFDTEKSQSAVTSGTLSQPYPGEVYPGGGGCNLSILRDKGFVTTSTYVEKKRWFSGAFTYHMPRDLIITGQMGRALQEAERVFGLDLTPETLYNLAPWSWALDWVTNAGDVMTNVSRWIQYGQVMKYGYIMEHTKSMKTYSFSPSVLAISGHPNNVATLSLVTETKKRLGANPFGFGITWDGLSSIQAAIAAALGFTHSRN